MVVALNMADLVEKSGDRIDVSALEKSLGCPVVMISALKNRGVDELIAAARKAVTARCGTSEATACRHAFDAAIEGVLERIEAQIPASVEVGKRRYYAVKLFERDAEILAELSLPQASVKRIEELVAACERDCDDDAESIITGERYAVIAHIVDACLHRAPARMSTSEKIDRIVTNRWLGLPIFALIMFGVYYLAISTFGTAMTDWVNDSLFGDGWELLGAAMPSVPALFEGWLTAAGASDMVISLVCDGIVAGVGAVLGFVPQMLVLFVLLAVLEDVGYMARIAFIMDRIFRRFGLSGKSFIPMLVATGCGVPGIMASRTIEQDRDRKMTIMTTGFIPCGAKMPIIGLFAGALFGGSAWVATSAYFIGVAAIVISGILLKKTKGFAGDPAPFVMELPAYHVPSVGNVLRATWERGWSFIKRAGTIILASSIILWFLQGFGFTEAGFGMVEDNNTSLLASIGGAVAFLFAPLGFGTWQATVATVTGLIAKENVVSTFGVLFGLGADLTEEDPGLLAAVGTHFTALSAYSFMIFNLLCAPCFAAMGAIKREMNNARWTLGAIGYMCGFAYVVSLIVYQLGGLITGEVSFGIGTIAAAAALVGLVYLLVRRNKYDENTLSISAVAAAAK